MSLANRQDVAVPPPAVGSFFDERPDLDAEVDAILNHPQLLRKEQLVNLAVILKDHLNGAVEFNADFDLLGEVTEQLYALRAMREKVMINGRAKEDVSARDLKEVVTASNTILQTLIKTQDQLVNQDRLRAIEKACVTVISTQTPEIQAAYFAALEIELDGIK